MDDDIVSKKQCLQILEKYTKETIESDKKEEIKEFDKFIKESDQLEEKEVNDSKAKEAVLKSFSTRPTSNQLDGLIGEQFILSLVYQQNEQEKEINFFVKILSKGNSIMYQIAKELLAFEKESFFYDKFVPYLREEGFDCDYVADSYLCESDTIVLEDLNLKSYKCASKNVSLDLSHCKIGLKTIAKFHSNTILFELKRTKELAWEYKLADAFPEIFEDTILSNGSSMVIKYYQHSIQGLFKLTALLPEGNVKHEEFNKAFLSSLEKIPSTYEEMAKKFRLTLSHNDLWCNNILYNYNDKMEVLSCKLIDFQAISLRPPMCDVLGFIYMNTRKSFRDQHLHDLLSYYYECFHEQIEQGGYNPTEILSEEEYWATYEFAKLNVKLHSIIDRSFTLIPESVYTFHSASEEMFSNFVFEGRGNIMMGLFNKYEDYREILTEELCELRSMLFGGE